VKPILIAGIGNLLLGDDGIGPTVVKAFAHLHTPTPDVDVEDLGTPGLELASYLAFRDAVILVDALHSDLEPGTIRIFGRDKILARCIEPRIGAHASSLADALEALQLAGIGPRHVALVCIAGRNWQFGSPLGAEAQSSLADARAAISSLLRAFQARLAASGIGGHALSDA
jgi:hydrogenase maturation protease